MKPIRWTQHAQRELGRREVDQSEAESAVREPDSVVPAQPPRKIFQKAYSDGILGREMLVRVVVEETESELVVVTLYKTSKLRKYSEVDER